MLAAKDIAQVIRNLDEIVVWSRENADRSGYFAALYRRVTVRVRDEIDKGGFENGPRMEALDVNFANRYFRAFEQWRAGETPSACWSVAFAATGQSRPIVLQHLLLGMNSHINLDLAVAAAQTCPGTELASLKTDFMRINALLASLLGEVRSELSAIWTPLRLVSSYLGGAENEFVRFGMDEARERAWSSASRINDAAPGERGPVIEKLDLSTRQLGVEIHNPGFPGGLVLRIVRRFEHGDVRSKIDVLANPATLGANRAS